MRKPLALLLAAALAAALTALPAGAAGSRGKSKKKTIHGSFSAQLLPFPKTALVGDAVGITEPGCNAGQEGIHKKTERFRAPAAGTLTATTQGFAGDWDLHITDKSGHAVVSSQGDQVVDAAPAEEEVTIRLKPRQRVGMTVCNWAGGPEAEVHYSFTFRIGKETGHGRH